MDWLNSASAMHQLRDFNDISCDPILAIGPSDGGGKTKWFASDGVQVEGVGVVGIGEEGVIINIRVGIR